MFLAKARKRRSIPPSSAVDSGIIRVIKVQRIKGEDMVRFVNNVTKGAGSLNCMRTDDLSTGIWSSEGMQASLGAKLSVNIRSNGLPW